MKQLGILLRNNYTRVLLGKSSKIHIEDCLSLFVNDSSPWKCYRIYLDKCSIMDEKLLIMRKERENYLIFAPVSPTLPLCIAFDNKLLSPLFSKNPKNFFAIQHIQKYYPYEMSIKNIHIDVSSARLCEERFNKLVYR